MNYRDIEEFLANEEFIQWVLNPTKELDLFWNNWLDANPDKKALALSAIEILKSVGFKVTPTNGDQYKRVLHKILEGRYSDNQPTPETKHASNYRFKPKQNSFDRWWRVAAVVAVLMTTFLTLYLKFDAVDQGSSDGGAVEWLVKANQKGQKSTLVLPDGTAVTLNADSRLIYPNEFSATRNVELQGEAFFEVAKDIKRPFTVKSDNIFTTALGTSFNIKAFTEEDNISVSLSTGKVSVSEANSAGDEKFYLNPGEKLTYDKIKGTINKTKLDKEEIMWKEGVLVFKKVGINEFVSKIERWYGVSVHLHGLPSEDWIVSGRFKNETLSLVLESISFAEDVNYELNNNNVELYFKNN